MVVPLLMVATTEEDGVDEMDDVCRTAAVAELELDERILEARTRLNGCTTILWEDILMGFIERGRAWSMDRP
eukprot:scaffold4386_cov138-Skeletonema_marinoi.AAC.5